GSSQPDGYRLAEGARWHDPAVAEAVGGIHHQQRKVLGEARVLKAVVEDQRLGPALDRRTCRGDAITSHPGGGYLRQQQRLVADGAMVVPCRIGPHGPALAPAIAAAQEVRLHTRLAEVKRQGDRHRRLAGAARDEIADADDRYFHRRPAREDRKSTRLNSVT